MSISLKPGIILSILNKPTLSVTSICPVLLTRTTALAIGRFVTESLTIPVNAPVVASPIWLIPTKPAPNASSIIVVSPEVTLNSTAAEW